MRKANSFVLNGIFLMFFVISVSNIASGVCMAAPEPIKIGHVCSITGWAGMLGSPQRDAMIAMVENINQRGGILGRPVKVYIEDDKSLPTTALLAATKLILDKKIDLLVGTTLTDCAQAIIPLAEKEQVPMIVTTPVVAPFNKWIFYVGPGDIRLAEKTLALTMKTFSPKRIALLHDTALYGNTGAKIIKKELSKYPGVSIAIEEKYEPNDTNMVPQMMKIKKSNPDVLIVYGAGPGPAIAAKAYKQLQMKTQVVGASGMAAPDFLKMSGPIAEEFKWGILCLRINLAETLPSTDYYLKNVYEPMNKLFQEKFGKDKFINVFHGSPMDAMVMATIAFEAAGTDDKAAVRDALEKVRFEGLLGNVAPGPTDHFEGAVDVSVLGMLKGGKFVPFQN